MEGARTSETSVNIITLHGYKSQETVIRTVHAADVRNRISGGWTE
jgi:hypothetical protein